MSRPSRPFLALATAAVLLLTGCGGEPDAPDRAPTPAPTPEARTTEATTPVGHETRSYARATEDGERVIDVDVLLPEQSGERPVILFSHGLGASSADFVVLTEPWLDAGYAVVMPLYPHTRTGVEIVREDVVNQPADASHVLDQVLADGELAPRLDEERIIAGGHSAGGITTVGLFTSGRDDRLDAGLVLAGAANGVGADFSGDPAPILFMHGDEDPVVPYEDGHAVFEADPWPAAFITFDGGGHLLVGSRDFDYLATVRDASLAFFDAVFGAGGFSAIEEALVEGATIENRLPSS